MATLRGASMLRSPSTGAPRPPEAEGAVCEPEGALSTGSKAQAPVCGARLRYGSFSVVLYL